MSVEHVTTQLSLSGRYFIKTFLFARN